MPSYYKGRPSRRLSVTIDAKDYERLQVLARDEGETIAVLARRHLSRALKSGASIAETVLLNEWLELPSADCLVIERLARQLKVELPWLIRLAVMQLALRELNSDGTPDGSSR